MAIDNPTIARKYSQALFEVACKKGQLEDIRDELNEIKQGLISQPKFNLFMKSPSIKDEMKKDLLDSILQKAHGLSRNLLNMSYDYGRMDNLIDIIDNFNYFYDKYKKIVRVDVITAFKLDDIQKEKLKESFKAFLGANEVVISEIIDNSIIGGVILKADNYIYDGSIKSKLEYVKKLLLK